MPETVVLTTSGATRTGRLSGTIHGGAALDVLVVDAEDNKTPVIVLAPHRRDIAGALLATIDGVPVVREGDEVVLTGGRPPTGDPRSPAFLATTVAVVTR